MRQNINQQSKLWRIGSIALVIFLASLILTQCVSFSAKRLSGTVLNGTTGEPVSGAYVVARWVVTRTILGAHPVRRGTCVRNETVITNSNGRYNFPFEWTSVVAGLGLDVESYVSIYKPGMIRQPGHVPPIDEVEPHFRLLPDTFDAVNEKVANFVSWKRRKLIERYDEMGEVISSARLDYLDSIGSAGSVCDGHFGSLPYWRATCEEAKQVISNNGLEELSVINRFCPNEISIEHVPPIQRVETKDLPTWTGAATEYREVFEQIEKDFGIQLEGLSRERPQTQFKESRGQTTFID